MPRPHVPAYECDGVAMVAAPAIDGPLREPGQHADAFVLDLYSFCDIRQVNWACCRLGVLRSVQSRAVWAERCVPGMRAGCSREQSCGGSFGSQCCPSGFVRPEDAADRSLVMFLRRGAAALSTSRDTAARPVPGRRAIMRSLIQPAFPPFPQAHSAVPGRLLPIGWDGHSAFPQFAQAARTRRARPRPLRLTSMADRSFPPYPQEASGCRDRPLVGASNQTGAPPCKASCHFRNSRQRGRPRCHR